MKRVLLCLLAVAVVFVFSSSIAVADCPDREGYCWAVPNCGNATCGPKKQGPMSYGTCWSWGSGCNPCHSQDTYRRQCKERYCPGKCEIVGCGCENWGFSFRDSSGSEIDN
ncbi:MAG: hypothetical protein JXB42_13620 [Deltaproteobacteria bacterium]|nr:hypothetical protein [Deltaproteobacteria bacterium]